MMQGTQMLLRGSTLVAALSGHSIRMDDNGVRPCPFASLIRGRCSLMTGGPGGTLSAQYAFLSEACPCAGGTVPRQAMCYYYRTGKVYCKGSERLSFGRNSR